MVRFMVVAQAFLYLLFSIYAHVEGDHDEGSHDFDCG
jgi:hypothetical protein